MRTKTLLFTAAVIASGFTAATAQSVYSVNAVGYVNVGLLQGFNLISNPLNTTNNSLESLFPSVPDFTTFYKWDENAQTFSQIATYFFGWDHPEYVLNPGEGAFLEVPSPVTITFVGEVLQGNLTNQIPSNFSIKSSKVPQSGLITTDLGLVANDFDTLYRWNPAAQGYTSIHTYFFGWDSEPTIAVGEAFFFQTTTANSWNRTFSVN